MVKIYKEVVAAAGKQASEECSTQTAVIYNTKWQEERLHTFFEQYYHSTHTFTYTHTHTHTHYTDT
jgi:hypothetical protein